MTSSMKYSAFTLVIREMGIYLASIVDLLLTLVTQVCFAAFTQQKQTKVEVQRGTTFS